MSHKLKKDSVFYIDEVEGFNSGINVRLLKDTLHMVGIVWNCLFVFYHRQPQIATIRELHTLFIAFLRRSILIMAMYREDIENTIPQTTNPDERRNSINRIREQHVILCRRAIQDGKTIVSIEHILIGHLFVNSFLNIKSIWAGKFSSNAAWQSLSSYFTVLLLGFCYLIL